MKLCKLLGLNVNLKNEESKCSQIITIMWKEKVLESDKREVMSSREVPPY